MRPNVLTKDHIAKFKYFMRVSPMEQSTAELREAYDLLDVFMDIGQNAIIDRYKAGEDTTLPCNFWNRVRYKLGIYAEVLRAREESDLHGIKLP